MNYATMTDYINIITQLEEELRNERAKYQNLQFIYQVNREFLADRDKTIHELKTKLHGIQPQAPCQRPSHSI